MKVMVIVKASLSSEAGQMPSEQLLTDMGNFNEELVKAGIMQAGEGLKPSSEGVRVHFRGTDRTLTDGPFAETKELIAGYWMWEVDSMGEAIEWVKRCPNPMMEDSDIEIRPVFEAVDFGEEFTPELREQEDQMRTDIVMQQAMVQPYLFFGGRCDEALVFYQSAVGAKVLMKMRFSESPDPVPEGMLQAGFEDKIMHASFTIGKQTIMASDGCDDKSTFVGFRLALSVATEDAAQRVFDALADGGKVDMPLVKTFWSPCYGMLTDKFGIGWMVMVPGEATC
ncbi:MAG: VOC family protein [Planctomycetaceae bacterium]|nr:VOC family protein [Planctomycetaceae bacterium]